MATLTPIDFLILDEHTAALDPKTAEIIMQLTDKIVKEKKVTTIMVTHNLRYAVEYGNRMIMMHQGNIILDKNSEEKAATEVDDILGIFNEISIECGNSRRKSGTGADAFRGLSPARIARRSAPASAFCAGFCIFLRTDL